MSDIATEQDRLGLLQIMLVECQARCMLVAMVKTLDRLRQAIRDSDKTRYRLAKKSGISESALSRLMSGERGLSIEAAEKLAEALELEIIIRPVQRKARNKKER